MTLTQVSRGRLGSKKTHTGCRTCKQRRIKCDEGRPSCIRCASTGRVCGGYEFWISVPAEGQQRSLQPRLSPVQTKCSPYKTPTEHQCFQFFLEQCSNPLAGPLEKDFWLCLVPQLSHTNHAVRYAVLTISCLYRDLYSPSTPSGERSVSQSAISTTTDAHSAALWYNKAIKATIKTLDKPTGDKEFALITCFLFLCIECIQGHDTDAIKLFIHGQNLVRYGGVKSQIQGADLEAMFTRLRHGAALFNADIPADPIPEEMTLAIPPTTPFSSIIEARKSLHTTIAGVHNFIVSVPLCHRERSRPEAVPTHILELQQINHLTLLSTWLTHSHHLLTDSHILTNPRNYLATLLLLIHYHLAMIMLPCVLSQDESVYDSQLPTFQKLVDLAEQVIGFKFKLLTCPAPFTFEANLIPALSVVALHCRNLHLRQRAAEMLHRTPRQEGLWEADLMRRICERVIELEHSGLPDDEWPPEKMRIREAFIRVRTVRDDGRKGNMVRFCRKPHGLQGDVDLWEEWFDK